MVLGDPEGPGREAMYPGDANFTGLGPWEETAEGGT